MNERRKFLMQSITALSAIGLGARMSRAEAPATRLSGHRFETYVNQAFTFYDPRTGTPTRMKLLAVQHVSSGPKLEQFSLVFRGHSGVTLDEGRYRVVGGPARRSELFITPTPGQNGAPNYRADFSLFV